MPGKKVPAIKVPSTSVPASLERTVGAPASDGEKAKTIRSSGKTVPAKTAVARSETGAKSALPARARTKALALDRLSIGEHSILNLSNALNGSLAADKIAERAYFLWLERGCPFGSPEVDWFCAEQELALFP